MSLINDMLRDLEARRAAELGKQDLQREIRPLPGRPAVSRPNKWALWLGVAFGAVIGAGVWLWETDPWSLKTAALQIAANSGGASSHAAPATPAASAPAPSSEVSPAVLAEAMRLAEGPAAVAAEAPPPAAPDQNARQDGPKPAATPAHPKAPGMAPAAVKGPATAAAIEQPAPAKSAGAVTLPLAQGNIEKTVVLGTARERADAEYRRAQGMLAAGAGTPAAVEALQAALKQDPTYQPARQSLLRILLESRRIDEAMAVLQDGLDQQPAHTGWAMSLARLQVERGDVAAGERTLAHSRSYGGTSAEYLGFYGYLLQQMGRPREAAEQYLAATKAAPGDGRWWFGLGQALDTGGHPEEARSAFRRALETGNLSADLMVLAEQKTR